ncbi:MAG TPA: type I DNA topoisomerase [Sphingobacteriaceae bacterium]|nr:type I DNA topoisomerase [Sphingobacteriaceae bacterium]
MSRSLVIVESPAKAKTIEKILGRRYKVAASMGHVRDLPKSQFGVDPERGFEPRYITIRGKGPILNQLRAEAQKVDKVLLATDPDREGEAISWHLAQALGLDPDDDVRVVFQEITKDAVKEAIKKPRGINHNLVNAQQARRILDRVVGYRLSPLLWRKIRPGLSAGRVQSVAVRLIVDREIEIENFEPQEYWSLTAHFATGGGDLFSARYHGDQQGKREINNKEEMDALLESLEGARFQVASVTRKERKRNPAPPFTTSTLQQEASRKLGFSVRRTMRVAQQLYEGLDIPGVGSVGLITYMRTDSTRVSQQAAAEAAAFIKERYGSQYVGGRRRSRQNNRVQDAHEAIRPTSVTRLPDDIKGALTRDQYRLYRLIWERFTASQMAPAVLDTVTVDIAALGPEARSDMNAIVEAGVRAIFRATGSVIKFPGFMQVYIEGTDDAENNQETGDKPLPPLREGEELLLQDMEPQQHFTQPPPRYTEASLVKALEEHGIGRPSTYAPTIETIQDRGYVVQEQKRFKPTELGRLVTKMLKEHFPSIIDIEFTAQMESELDAIGEAGRDWREVLQGFYEPFTEALAKADKAIQQVDLEPEETDEVCSRCGRNMVIKYGRYGPFLACPGYPECKNTQPLLEKIGVNCPKCGRDLVVRRTKRGRVFYGCSGYPDCDFLSWDKPAGRNCPRCGTYMVEKSSRRRGKHLACANEECGYTENIGETSDTGETGETADTPAATEEVVTRNRS